jgi:hypothetical protein
MPSAKPSCSECDHVFTAAPRAELQQVDGELVERKLEIRQRRTEQATATTLEQLIDVGKRRGMKHPRAWAQHVLAARQAKGQWRAVA